MKNFLLFIAFTLIITLSSRGQDVIYKEDGQEMKARILEVGRKSLLYKDFNDPDFTTRILSLSKVTKIRFEDGGEQVFDNKIAKHFIAFSLIGSQAMGDFGSQDTRNEKSGYATEGGGGGRLDYGIYLIKNLALCLSMGGMNNRLDTSSMKEPYSGISNFSINASESGDKVLYETKFFLLGPLYTFKLGRKLLWDFRLQSGLLSLRRGSFFIRGGAASNTFYYSYEPARGTGIGFDLGSAIRFNLFKWMGLRFSADILWAKPRLKGEVESNITNAGLTDFDRQQDVFYQKFQTMSFGLGLVFMFGR